MDRIKIKSLRGSGILEILIVLAGMLILALIAVITYSGRSGDARLTQATEEVRSLANSEKDAAVAHGVFVPLQVLNDFSQLPSQRSIKSDDPANEPESVHGINGHLTAQDKPGSPEPPIKNILEWKGPFASFRRVYFGSNDGKPLTAAPDQLAPETLRRDYPIDPWGVPYRFYSPIGIIGTAAAKSTLDALDSDGFSDGVITGEDDRFDSYAIVSYGPDGQSDSVSNGNDDIIILFSLENVPAH